MLETALKLIKKIEDQGFVAYIVGGFVRDYLLGITSHDIDICTNARPSDIRNIFQDACLPNEAYGSTTVLIKNIHFEITTFRKEITYINNRKPIEFEYIDDLLEDLKRRDFCINTLCMDKNGNIIDLLNGKEDLEKKEINTVGDSYTKFVEDSLRILRAVRFATSLNFSLSSDVKESIKETKQYVLKLSYSRKKEELNKIFTSVHVKYGVKLLLELGLDQQLKLFRLKEITYFEDLIGIWAQLEVDDIYPFTKNEKELMNQIRTVLKLDNLDSLVLYQYGLYVNSIAAGIKGINKKLVTKKYNELSMKSKNEMKITGLDIMKLLHTKPGKYLKEILKDLEEKIITNQLSNEVEALKQYVLEKYGSTQI